MSNAPHDPPTTAEWRILKIVFELGACAARDVTLAAGERFGWSQSTVKTLLRRLVDKGHLQTEAVGSSFRYRPSRPIHKALRESADQLLEQATDEAMGPLLQYLVKQSRLSREDLDALRTLIDSRKPREERR